MKTIINKIWRGIVMAIALGGTILPSNAYEYTYDGTGNNSKIIFIKGTTDLCQKTEFVYPSTDLVSMKGLQIRGLTFYTTSAEAIDWSCDFTIFLKEITSTKLSSFEGNAEAQIVFEGKLGVDSNGQMVINFTNPYNYNGNNLLIGIYRNKGINNTHSFIVKNSSLIPAGATIFGTNGTSLEYIKSVNSDNKLDVLPKVTFEYWDASESESPLISVKGFESGDNFKFADGEEVPAGTIQTFTISNQGTADLKISSVEATGGFNIKSGGEAQVIEPSNSADIVVSTPAEDAKGTLTITSNDTNNGTFVINLESKYKVPAPVMVVSPLAIDMRTVKANQTASITIKNEGDAELNANVASSDSRFTVNPETIQVGVNEEKTVTVTFNYKEGEYGKYSGTITITPAENGGDPVNVTVAAKVLDPNIWTEYFDKNECPEGWEAGNNWRFEDGVAKGTYEHNANDYLTTPTLKAAAGDELSFDYESTANYSDILIEGSKDGGAFTKLENINLSTDPKGTHTLTISEAGKWRFRFLNDSYNLDNFEGLVLDADAPILEVSPLTPAAFGKVTAQPEPVVYTVTNTGTGLLNVSLTSDNEDFTVSPASLTDIGQDESKTFSVIFNFDVENLGEKSGVITVTPEYNENAYVTINASATAKDPNRWEEDFEDGKLPSNWSTDLWKVENVTSGQGGNGTFVAYAGTSGNPYLVTPRLQASKGEELTFDVCGGIDNIDKLTVEYSNDGNKWTAADFSPVEATGPCTFTAPADDYYYIRFTGKYGALDNFSGFKLAPKTHEVAITGSSIPNKANEYLTYTASIYLEEKNGLEEKCTVKLKIDGEVVETKEVTLAANEEQKISLSFVPVEMDNFAAQILITYAETEELYTPVVNVIVAGAPRLSESEEIEVPEGRQDVLVIEYSSQPGWTSIAMPFALNDAIMEQLFGENYMAFELDKYDDGIITFREVSQYSAGYPYMVYAPEGTKGEKTIVENVHNIWTYGMSDVKGGVTFQATFKPMSAGTMSGYFTAHKVINTGTSRAAEMPAVPQLTECDENSSMKGYRAYFEFGSSVVGVPELAFYDKDGNYSAINELNNVEENAFKGIYTIQGIKLERITTPGLYIIDGKKVMVK